MQDRYSCKMQTEWGRKQLKANRAAWQQWDTVERERKRHRANEETRKRSQKQHENSRHWKHVWEKWKRKSLNQEAAAAHGDGSFERCYLSFLPIQPLFFLSYFLGEAEKSESMTSITFSLFSFFFSKLETLSARNPPAIVSPGTPICVSELRPKRVIEA